MCSIASPTGAGWQNAAARLEALAERSAVRGLANPAGTSGAGWLKPPPERACDANRPPPPVPARHRGRQAVEQLARLGRQRANSASARRESRRRLAGADPEPSTSYRRYRCRPPRRWSETEAPGAAACAREAKRPAGAWGEMVSSGAANSCRDRVLLGDARGARPPASPMKASARVVLVGGVRRVAGEHDRARALEEGLQRRLLAAELLWGSVRGDGGQSGITPRFDRRRDRALSRCRAFGHGARVGSGRATDNARVDAPPRARRRR